MSFGQFCYYKNVLFLFSFCFNCSSRTGAANESLPTFEMKSLNFDEYSAVNSSIRNFFSWWMPPAAAASNLFQWWVQPLQSRRLHFGASQLNWSVQPRKTRSPRPFFFLLIFLFSFFPTTTLLWLQRTSGENVLPFHLVRSVDSPTYCNFVLFSFYFYFYFFLNFVFCFWRVKSFISLAAGHHLTVECERVNISTPALTLI